ncbi:MAG: hypothetical protein RSE93_00020 [Oscillospiraceae bacterium]
MNKKTSVWMCISIFLLGAFLGLMFAPLKINMENRRAQKLEKADDDYDGIPL